MDIPNHTWAVLEESIKSKAYMDYMKRECKDGTLWDSGNGIISLRSNDIVLGASELVGRTSCSRPGNQLYRMVIEAAHKQFAKYHLNKFDGEENENRNKYYLWRMVVVIMYYVRYWVRKDGNYTLNATEDCNKSKHLPARFVYEERDKNKKFVGNWMEATHEMIMRNIMGNLRNAINRKR